MGELSEAAGAGDRVRTLQRLRDALAARIETAPDAAVAQLSKQLTDVMRELAQIAPPQEESTVDDLAARRSARRSAAAVSQRPAGSE